MSQSRRSNPKYCHYAPKTLGVVRIDGKDHYLGRYDSPESWKKCHPLTAEWLSRRQADGPEPPISAKPSDSISINEMLLAYWQFAETFYEWVTLREAGENPLQRHRSWTVKVRRS